MNKYVWWVSRVGEARPKVCFGNWVRKPSWGGGGPPFMLKPSGVKTWDSQCVEIVVWYSTTDDKGFRSGHL